MLSAVWFTWLPPCKRKQLQLLIKLNAALCLCGVSYKSIWALVLQPLWNQLLSQPTWSHQPVLYKYSLSMSSASAKNQWAWRKLATLSCFLPWGSPGTSVWWLHLLLIMLHYWLMWIPENRKHHFSCCWMHFELSSGQWLPMFQFHTIALTIWAVMVLCFVLDVDASERVITFISAAIQRGLTNIQVFTLLLLCQLLGNSSFTLHWWNHERRTDELPFYQITLLLFRILM